LLKKLHWLGTKLRTPELILDSILHTIEMLINGLNADGLKNSDHQLSTMNPTRLTGTTFATQLNLLKWLNLHISSQLYVYNGLI
jgi:hypothetical protein